MTREEAIRIIESNCSCSGSKLREACAMFIPELAESEDERIRKDIVTYLTNELNNVEQLTPRTNEVERWLAWLEKHKEPIPIPDKFSGLKSLLLQYLQSAANRKDDAEIEDDTDLWGRKILDYVWKQEKKQKEQSITANDLDEEIHRFFDNCIDVYEAKLYGSISERVIPVDCYELTARHFAKWGEEQKEQKTLSTEETELNSLAFLEQMGYTCIPPETEQKPVECIKFDNEFQNQISHLIASVLNGEHEYNEGFVKYVAQSLLGYAEKEQKPVECIPDSIKFDEGFKTGREIGFREGVESVKPAEINEYEIIKKHITRDSLSSEVNKRLKECGWYVTDEKPSWGEEDEYVIDKVIEWAKIVNPTSTIFEKIPKERFIERLKSLHPQPQWKPSEQEQIPYIDFVIKPHKGDDNNPYDMRVSEAQEYAINRGFGIPYNDGEVYIDERHMIQTIGNILRWADEHPKEQKPVKRSEDKFPKDIEKDATLFCFDKGINITPHQAKEIAIHYLMIGHNEGYVEGRKNAHIPAKELGLPSSMDFKQEWSEEDDRMLRRCIKSVESSKNFADSQTFNEAKDKEKEWLKSLPERFNLK